MDEAIARCNLNGCGNTGAQVIPVLIQPGIPTVDVPVANIATFRIPDAAKIASNTFKEVSANIPSSSF